MSRPKKQVSQTTSKSTSRTRTGGKGAGSRAGSGGTITITSVSPTGTVANSSPTVRATVKDGESSLSGSGIKLYLDGEEQGRFNYSRATGSLRCSTGGLSSGSHEVEIEATADGGRRTARKSWTFTIKR